MADINFPDDLIAAQRRVHAAWAAVERHRLAVDEQRHADADERDTARRAAGEPVDDTPRWRRGLRPWTEEEDAEHARLMAETQAAATALHAAHATAGIDRGYDHVKALHVAARA